MLVSHDVDCPFDNIFLSPCQLTRRFGGDIVKRRSGKIAFQRLLNWIDVNKRGNIKNDLYSGSFNRIMMLSEKYGLKSAFYFMTDRKSSFDGNYKITHPFINQLLLNIHQRGHEIGLHASYESYNDSSQTQKEFKILNNVCNKNKIDQQQWGSRQHYLRWKTPTTFQNLEEAGLDYDATLSFADHPGFRCGVCYEFPAFNVVTSCKLKLRIRPLIVMEGSVIGSSYLGLGLGPAALEKIIMYKEICRKFNGNFTLLWHNSSLILEDEVRLYEAVLSQTSE